MGKLTAQQEIFCREYLVDLNATQAAIRAGYKERTATQQASRLLTNVNVLARVKELKDKRADELELDAYWVLKRLKDVSDRCMQAVPVEVWDPEAKCMVPTGDYEFDSVGATKATELIGKHIGIFNGPMDAQILNLKIKLAEKEIELKENDVALKQLQIAQLQREEEELFEEEEDGLQSLTDAIHESKKLLEVDADV